MPLLATLYYPSLIPVGPPSVLALLICAALAWFGSRARNPRGWEWVVGAAPTLLVIATALALLSADRHPDADDHAAIAVCVAFGFGLALGGFRSQRSWLRISGLVFTTLYGTFAVFIAAALFNNMRIGLGKGIPPIWGAGAFAVCWLPVAAGLYRRSARLAASHRGSCHMCGYDLRGSLAAGRCPECGTPILQPEQVPPLESAESEPSPAEDEPGTPDRQHGAGSPSS